MAKITRQSKLTFGKNRGQKLCQCDTGYLEWVVKNLANSDFHVWATAAAKELEARKAGEAKQASYDDLEKQADQLLRDAGFKP